VARDDTEAATTSLTDILNALHHSELTDAVYLFANCPHVAVAPSPSPDAGDAEVVPAFVECPVCGVPRRVMGFDATRGD